MLRISIVEEDARHALLRVEGRLRGEWVPELLAACERAGQPQRRVELDLAEVAFADLDGVALIQRLCRAGVTVRACSPFLAEELKVAEG